ncbi:hypothetical protein HKD37_02G004594 [Glycine soja]
MFYRHEDLSNGTSGNVFVICLASKALFVGSSGLRIIKKEGKNPQGMYPPLFSLNLVDVPSTRTDPQEMYPLLFSFKPKEREESKEFSDCVVLNSLTREKGDTKEFRQLVLRSFGKGRRETQKEFKRLVLSEFFLAKGEENEKMNSTSFQGYSNNTPSQVDTISSS